MEQQISFSIKLSGYIIVIFAVSSFLCEFQFSNRGDVVFCSKYDVLSAVKEQKINQTVNYHGNAGRA